MTTIAWILGLAFTAYVGYRFYDDYKNNRFY